MDPDTFLGGMLTLQLNTAMWALIILECVTALLESYLTALLESINLFSWLQQLQVRKEGGYTLSGSITGLFLSFYWASIL